MIRYPLNLRHRNPELRLKDLWISIHSDRTQLRRELLARILASLKFHFTDRFKLVTKRQLNMLAISEDPKYINLEKCKSFEGSRAAIIHSGPKYILSNFRLTGLTITTYFTLRGVLVLVLTARATRTSSILPNSLSTIVAESDRTSSLAFRSQIVPND